MDVNCSHMHYFAHVGRTWNYNTLKVNYCSVQKIQCNHGSHYFPANESCELALFSDPLPQKRNAAHLEKGRPELIHFDCIIFTEQKPCMLSEVCIKSQ